jgi:methylglutaconyl-CoA hydratase
MRLSYQRNLDYLGCNKMAILVSIPQDIVTITLNRPEKRNAMDGFLVQELTDALTKIAAEKKVRVLILNANGENFCAGADIQWMQQIAQGSDENNKADALQLAALMRMIYRFPKPVIVLAHGATLGGGLGLLAASDIAIAADNASFSFSEVKMGITPSVISPYVLAAIGERAARYYFLTAERFGAEEAQRLGLVHRVVHAEALQSTGIQLAETILKNSSSACSEAKRLIQHVSHRELTDDLMHFTADHLATLRTSAEAREGLQAFIEKRLPKWS